MPSSLVDSYLAQGRLDLAEKAARCLLLERREITADERYAVVIRLANWIANSWEQKVAVNYLHQLELALPFLSAPQVIQARKDAIAALFMANEATPLLKLALEQAKRLPGGVDRLECWVMIRDQALSSGDYWTAYETAIDIPPTEHRPSITKEQWTRCLIVGSFCEQYRDDWAQLLLTYAKEHLEQLEPDQWLNTVTSALTYLEAKRRFNGALNAARTFLSATEFRQWAEGFLTRSLAAGRAGVYEIAAALDRVLTEAEQDQEMQRRISSEYSLLSPASRDDIIAWAKSQPEPIRSERLDQIRLRLFALVKLGIAYEVAKLQSNSAELDGWREGLLWQLMQNRLEGQVVELQVAQQIVLLRPNVRDKDRLSELIFQAIHAEPLGPAQLDVFTTLLPLVEEKQRLATFHQMVCAVVQAYGNAYQATIKSLLLLLSTEEQEPYKAVFE